MDDRTMTGRVVAVLQTVRSLGPDVSLAELAVRTGLPKPTTLRIARNLVAHGLLERRRDGFRLGPELAAFGVDAIRHQGYQQAAYPILRELHQRTGQLAWFAMMIGDRITVVDRAFSTDSQIALTRPWPDTEIRPGLAATAVGRLVLGHHPAWMDDLVRTPLDRVTPYTIVDPGQLRTAVRRGIDDGYASESEQFRHGVACTAAPVHDATGRLVGAVAVTGPAGQVIAQRDRHAVLRAAAGIRKHF